MDKVGAQIDRFGGLEALLALLPAAYVASVVNYCHLDDHRFHTDLLAKVLGYTTLPDTLPVMRTCKRWYVSTQSRTFWRKRISDKIWKDYRSIKCIELFDPFCIVKETLREQLEWLFRRGWIFSVTDRNNDYCIVRKIDDDHQVSMDKLDMKYPRISKMSPLIDEYWFPQNNEGVKWSNRIRLIVNGIFVTRNTIWIASDGAKFEGGATLDAEKYIVPHGDGKWTFPDGTILEGVGVAWMGEPRKAIKRAKMTHNNPSGI